MGFIASSTTQTVKAYMTQIGRVKLLYSSATFSQVKYFSLHDNDIDYKVTSKFDETTSLYNNLKSGFVPDITGDADCIKSVAQANIVDYESFLIYGGDLVVLSSPTSGLGTGTPIGGVPSTGG